MKMVEYLKSCKQKLSTRKPFDLNTEPKSFSAMLTYRIHEVNSTSNLHIRIQIRKKDLEKKKKTTTKNSHNAQKYTNEYEGQDRLLEDTCPERSVAKLKKVYTSFVRPTSYLPRLNK